MADKFIEDYIGRGIFEGAPDTPEEVDAYLREQGYDPDSLVSRMKIRIGEALQNAKARTEREAAMKHTQTSTLAEMEGISATLRQQMASANEQQAALVAVVEAARELVDRATASFVMPPLGGARLMSVIKEIADLTAALNALDALTPDPDDTRELQAVRDAG